MRRIILLLLITVAAVSQCLAKNSIGDWQTVRQDVPRGWGIVVVTSMTFPCLFDHATENELICTPIQRGDRESNDAEIHLRRDRIREIRVEKREGANMMAGAGGGAGLAAILGALLIPGGRGVSAYALGLGGASMGAHYGRETHILRGKVVYRRAIPDQASASMPGALGDVRKGGSSTGKGAHDVAVTPSAWMSIAQTVP